MKSTLLFQWVRRSVNGGQSSGLQRVFLIAALLAVAGMGLPVQGQGMPPGARKNIHTLLNEHDQVQRELQLTEAGYEAITWSSDSRIAAALQEHVQQMQDRLESGMAVRRWDPAFAEYRAYYDEIDFSVEKTENGVKIVAHGKTPDAVKVARNHAKVIDEFVSDGWAAHDARHPAALASVESEGSSVKSGGRCCGGKGQGAGAGCGGSCEREASGQQDNQ